MKTDSAVESLGHVTTSSGDLLVIDFGLLRLWSGSDVPFLAEDDVPEGIADLANAAVDYEISGRDALGVAALLDYPARKGRFVFDWPAGGADIVEQVRLLADDHGLEANAAPIERMPHLRRVQTLLAEQPDGAEVPFHGPWAIGIRGLAANVRFRVNGLRCVPGSGDSSRWAQVWVEVSAAPVAASHEIGTVLVDEARLLFCDPAALSHFVTDEPSDGLFDLVFWGADAVQVAADLAVGDPADDGSYGWSDLSLEELQDHGRRLHEMHDRGDRRFAYDVRPHDDHYALLRQMRSAPTGSGTIAVGVETMTGLFTTWGDGAFVVYRDVDADGRLCRVRVDFEAN